MTGNPNTRVRSLRTRPVAAAIVLAMTLAAAVPAGATQTPGPRPFAFFNQNPLVQVYGLPAARGARLLAAGENALAFNLQFSSHFVDERHGDETLLLDGESSRSTLVYRRGLGAGLQARVAAPFITHSGGFADGFIDGFHDVTGLNDGGRSRAPHGRQVFRYRRAGVTRLDVSDSPAGLGDIRLALAGELANTAHSRASWHAQLKLPTGDADKLTGSGAADLALWAAVDRQDFLLPRVYALAALGGLYTGKGDVFDGMRRRAAAFGWVTLGYRWSSRLRLQTQLYTHTPLYRDSRLDALSGVAVQGAAGLAWLFSPRTQLQGAIIEDLHVNTAPDVSFSLSLQHGF